jgi:2-amino-4-hydroxy-6-hydroxymethyldihydropteridine diphosphokinase
MIHLNIGSNKGNRTAMIDRAVVLIGLAFAGKALHRSDPIETEPWGFNSSNMFLNIGLTIDDTTSDAEALLDKVKAIEKQISNEPHRDNSGAYIDRPIDIDIIAIDNMVYHSDRLDVPHRHLSSRLFVLKPMAQLCPDWTHPISEKTPQQMLNDLNR